MRPQTSLLIFLFLHLCNTGLFAQQHPHPVWRNYTPDDGLPSSEVHYCIETPDGYMWFATDNGLSRFDGYAFKNYGAKDGLTDPVIFYMQIDTAGALWLATMSGKLFYVKQDRIHPYSGNEQIRDQLEAAAGIQPRDFFIEAENNKYVSYRGFGIVQITGQDSIIHHKPFGKNIEYFSLEKKGRWISNWYKNHSPSIRNKISQQYWKKNRFAPFEFKSDSTYYISDIFRVDKYSSVWTKAINGELYVFAYKRLYELKNRSVSRAIPLPFELGEYKTIYEGKNGHLYLGMDNQKGLFHFKNFKGLVSGKPQVLLAGSSPSHIFEDSRGNFWVSTIDKGLFVSQKTDWEVYDQSTGLNSNLVSSIAIKNESNLFVGLRNGDVYELNKQTQQHRPLPPLKCRSCNLVDMAYHSSLDELWIGIDGQNYYKDGKWRDVAHTYFDPTQLEIRSTSGLLAKNLKLHKNGKQLWGTGPYLSFTGIDVYEKKVIFYSYEKGLPPERTLAVHQTAEDTVWVGNTRGLFLLKGIQGAALHLPEPDDVILATRVEDLAELSDGSLVIATKGRGIAIKKGPQLRVINADSGLTTDMVENVFVDEKNHIWAGTLNGLNKISGFSWEDTTSLAIRQFTTQNGLPSNEINKVETRGNDVWVATNNGLLHFTDHDTINTRSNTPILEKLLVNGKEAPFGESGTFSYAQNNINIEYVTINFKQNGDIPYRYRLPPDQQNWISTKSRSINFSNLGEGNYTFEVQSQNEDGVWSSTAAYRFEVAPPFWRSWWFMLISALAIGFGIYQFLIFRTKQIKRTAETALQLEKLEGAALRAQMNPHFIFNCLNSISNFINKGDKRAANFYLSTFAKLIRGILNHSRADRISLEDELQLINNYLKLEQLRFENRFEFELVVDEGIDPFEVQIPPMIVQPFIENAIIHGLSRKKEPGKIAITYQLEQDYLKAIITDNGIGITASKAARAGGATSHKSVGMTITQKRLELTSGKNQKGRFETHEITAEDGQVLGTKVEIWVPMAAL